MLSLLRVSLLWPPLTVILRATLSSWDASRRILWTMRRRAPPSGGGREHRARASLPDTRWSWTAACWFFRASRPCHTMGYFCKVQEISILLSLTIRRPCLCLLSYLALYQQGVNHATMSASNLFNSNLSISSAICTSC